LTAPTGGIAGDIAERWAPATTLEPLGNEVGSLVPAATIGVIGAPVEAAPAGSVFVDRPGRSATVQRSAAKPPTTSPATIQLASTLPSPPMPYRIPVVAGDPTTTAQRSLVSAADPVGAAGTSTASVAAEPVAQPETEASVRAQAPHEVASPALATIQRDVMAETERRASTAVRPVGLGAPLVRDARVAHVQRTVAPSDPDGRYDARGPVQAERPPRVPVQRLSLGDLPVAPSRRIGASESSPVGSEPATTPDRADPPPATEAVASGDASSIRGDALLAPSAVLTGTIDVSRLAIADRPHPTRGLARPTAGRAESAALQRNIDDGSEVTSETSPDRGSTTSKALTRFPADPPEPHDAPIRGLVPTLVGPEPRAVPVQRQRPDVHVAMSPELKPGRSPVLMVARSVAESGPIDIPLRVSPIRVASRASAPASGPSVQRSPASPVTVLARFPSSVEVGLPLARPLPTPAARSVDQLELQRAPEPASSGSDGGGAMGASESGGTTTSIFSTHESGDVDVAIQRATGESASATPPPAVATSTPGGGLSGGSDKDLDELARRLYDRIRRRLSSELLADRERAGMLTDLG
jgi:hypothetical protein